MKGGKEATSRFNINNINNISNELFSHRKNESTNTKLSNENNNTKKKSLEFKKKELIEMYGKYLDKDLLDKELYDETTIHTLYKYFKTKNKEIIVKVSKNETITFK